MKNDFDYGELVFIRKDGKEISIGQIRDKTRCEFAEEKINEVMDLVDHEYGRFEVYYFDVDEDMDESRLPHGRRLNERKTYSVFADVGRGGHVEYRYTGTKDEARQFAESLDKRTFKGYQIIDPDGRMLKESSDAYFDWNRGKFNMEDLIRYIDGNTGVEFVLDGEDVDDDEVVVSWLYDAELDDDGSGLTLIRNKDKSKDTLIFEGGDDTFKIDFKKDSQEKCNEILNKILDSIRNNGV